MLANLYSRSSAPRVTCMARDHRTSGGLVGRPSCNTQWPPTRPACARSRHAPPLPMVPTRSHGPTSHVRTRVRAPDGSPLTWPPDSQKGDRSHDPRARAGSSAHTRLARPFARASRVDTLKTKKCARAGAPLIQATSTVGKSTPNGTPKNGNCPSNFFSPLRGSSVRTAPRSAPRAPPNWTKSTRMTLSTS